ncbi:MAG TPA: MATE family efflux transporter [Caulobacteraceae bacterium]|jgi:MATE family multidrug resistance protein|nr:MATE family efflux transporter [Caulobacteraceae bacterium]
MDAPAASTVSRSGAPAELVFQDLSALLRLAGPVVLSRLGIMTMGLTDTVVVGRYSAVQLGYHALGWAPTAVVLTVAISLLSGVPVMTSRAIGEGRRHLAGAVLRRGLAYGGQIGLVSTLVLAGGGPWFLQHVGLSPGLAAGAGRVLIVFALSLTPLCLGTAASMWLEALGKPGVATVAMWLANLVNLAIDLVLVPGHFGLPALGAVGGACATLGSRTALMAALFAYIATMKEARGLGVFDKPARDAAAEAEQRKIGYGAGASGFFEVASFAGMNIVAGWIGALAVAGYTVVMTVASLVFMVPLGLATATSVLVGRAYGARDPRGVNRAGAIGFAVTAAFGIAVSLLVWPLAGPIAAAYTTDPRVLAMGQAALVLSCLFYLPDALQVVVAQSLRARGDVWVPSGTHFVSYILVMAPLAWVLAIPFGMGVNGIVWSVIASSLISAGLLLGRFWMLRRAAA